MGVPSKSTPIIPAEAIEEVMLLYRSLTSVRPSAEEVEAAASVLDTSAAEEEAKLEDIEKLPKPADLPEEIFSVLREARRCCVLLNGAEQRREAQHVVDLEERFAVLDGLIQAAASRLLSNSGGVVGVDMVVGLVRKEKEKKGSLDLVPSFKSQATDLAQSTCDDTEKLSLIKVASLIETSARDGSVVLDLRGKLMDQIEWLPLSLGRLQHAGELDVSENRIAALPKTIGGLRLLTKLDAHSNQLANLPESFGSLTGLTDLDLHANRLSSLPASFGNLNKLANLDLSSNIISALPDTLGSLTSLRRLNVETNELEELPYTIGSCSSLVELRLDFNNLRALPEAVGKLESLEMLTLHYNRIKGLPTTMSSLSKLRELDVSFNELESIPESLCFATGLVRLDVGRNFADLRSLPRSIGNLENLEVLDISNNQIRVLPESFRFLSKLRVFAADETPLELPLRDVVKLGAQAVVQYIADIASPKVPISPPVGKKGVWFWLCSLFRPRRKDGRDSQVFCAEV